MVNAQKIKELMQEKGIANKEMAETVGVSEAMMTYITRGLREPNVRTLALVAHKLDVTVDELLTFNV